MTPLVLINVFVFIMCLEIWARSEHGPSDMHRSKSFEAYDERPTLSADVTPSHYTLEIKLDEDSFINNTFNGTVTIDLHVEKNITNFSLYGSSLSIIDSHMNFTNVNETAPSIKTNTDTEDLIKILLSEEIKAGKYSLTINYTGKFGDTANAAFYKGTYTKDGEIKYFATTQFQATEARKVFPCFDEPSFKATFNISITFPKKYNVLGNMNITHDDERNPRTVTFGITPIMATYSVGFIISEFTCQSVDGIANDGTLTNVCTKDGTGANYIIALTTAPLILNIMANYTSYNYSHSQMSKLTQVAIPNFALGTIENWGLITYSEDDLLWDARESSTRHTQSVVTNIAHQLSHQWFGDLLTPYWWNYTFLTEGFATYFEYHAPDQLRQAQEEEWELTKQFVVEQVQSALMVDSYGDVFPLSPSGGDFGNKGGSIFRMIHHFMGFNNFKDGLRNLFSMGYTYKTNIKPEDVWAALQDTQYVEKAPIPELLNNWIYQQGYPLLYVVSTGQNVIISQEQFLFDSAGNTTWYVPISYTLWNESDFSDTQVRAWLKPDEDLNLTISLNNTDWIVLNIQQTGYYRVNYDEHLWENIFKALKANISVIDEINRSQLIDDLFNLARADKKNLEDVFNLIQILENDKSYYTWYSVFNGFSYMLQRVNEPDILSALKEHVRKAATTFFQLDSFFPLDNEKHVSILRKVLALKWACRLDVGWCVQNSSDLFKDFPKTYIHPDLREVVYCTALKHSGNISRDFNVLFDQYKSTLLETERVTILNALGCANNRSVRQSYLKKSLNGDVRLQDAFYVFSSVYSNNEADGVDDVLNFVITNHRNITQQFQDDGSTVISLIETLTNLFTKQSQISILNDFLNLNEVFKDSVTSLLKIAQTKLKETDKVELNLMAYFRNHKNVGFIRKFQPGYLLLILIVILC